MPSQKRLRNHPRKLFYFTITYFTLQGKMYLECEYPFECRYTKGVDSPTGRDTPDLEHLRQHVRGLLHSGGQMGMPGEVDEGWEGYILLQHPLSNSILLPPKSTP